MNRAGAGAGAGARSAHDAVGQCDALDLDGLDGFDEPQAQGGEGECGLHGGDLKRECVGDG